MSVVAAASADDAAAVAPSAASASTLPRLRLWTVSGKPACMILRDMGRPIFPSPMNETFGIGACSFPGAGHTPPLRDPALAGW